MKKNTFLLPLWIKASASAISFILMPSLSFAVDYQAIDLGTLDGGTVSFPHAINNNGLIVGRSYVDGGDESSQHAVAWINGDIHDLGTLGGSASVAYGVNDDGYAVGASSIYGDQFAHASMWIGDQIFDLVEITQGEPNTNSVAFAINNAANFSNRIVGYSIVTDIPEAEPQQLTTEWTLSAPVTVHETFSGGTISSANDVSDQGVIVGNSGIENREFKIAALWSAEGEITTLPLPPQGYGSFAKEINNNDVVVGTVYKKNTSGDYIETHAVAWFESQLFPLGVLPGGNSSVAYSINDFNQAVGGTYFFGRPDGQPLREATLWHAGEIINLNDYLTQEQVEAGWYLEMASATNNKGWIIGSGVNTNSGESHAFLLRPIPE